MLQYQAPLQDIFYSLFDLHKVQNLQKYPVYQEVSEELMRDVLSEGAKFCQEVLNPLTQSGDAEGCHFANQNVKTPKGFPEAYQKFHEMGWGSMSQDPAFGGQGLPKCLNFVLDEIICASNLSFGMYPGLTQGAVSALQNHGSEVLKQTYLPKLISGEWSGTMCLTEAQAGTDLGLLRSRAQPDGQGSYQITGQKIFISGGDHDLCENIIHMVLARLPDAPKGVKGISLFLVPKYIPDALGQIGTRNQLFCSGLEQKMGIHACATCSMSFEGAQAWLIGAPHKGLRAMFTMMNAARLGVGLQGLGLAEAACQMSLSYALQREQGRVLNGNSDLKRSADLIVHHPQIQKSLQTQAAYNEGCRALAYYLAYQMDIAEQGDSLILRQNADEYVQLMTPIIKAFFTDIGFDNCNRALQIFGGHGYIRDWGMEQLVRDARITQIYEGTNGIQALDLVGRKLSQNFGRLLRHFFHPVLQNCQKFSKIENLQQEAVVFEKHVKRLQQATAAIAQTGASMPDKVAAISSEYLSLFAHVALADQWMQMLVQAEEILQKTDLEQEKRDFFEKKQQHGRFYMHHLLCQGSSLFAQIMGGLK